MPVRWIVVWIGVAVLAICALLWCGTAGLRFVHWVPFVAATGTIAAIGLVYGLSGRSARLANMAQATLLWMLASLFGALLTYAAAAQAGPLHDAEMNAVDAAFGFEWTAWYGVVAAHPLLRLPLSLVYTSLLPQILLSITFLSFSGRNERSAEMLMNFTIAIILTAAIFHLWPSLGPCSTIPEFRAAYVDKLIELRAGDRTPIDMMHLQGLIAFPSFHATLGMLFAYALRRTPLFLPIAILNGVMLLAIPSEGGHYLTDLIAGLVVAGLAIAAAQALLRRLPAPTASVAPQVASRYGRSGEVS